MKAITTKEFVSLVIIAISAPILALALFAGARAMATGNESLLLALTLGGAVISGLNGFGRRTANAAGHSHTSGKTQSKAALTS